MNGEFKAREIRESKDFVDQKQLIQPNAKRLDEQLHSVTWALARNPEYGTQVQNTQLYGVKTDPFPDAPSLIIWYTFTDDKVELWWIELVEVEDLSE